MAQSKARIDVVMLKILPVVFAPKCSKLQAVDDLDKHVRLHMECHDAYLEILDCFTAADIKNWIALNTTGGLRGVTKKTDLIALFRVRDTDSTVQDDVAGDDVHADGSGADVGGANVPGQLVLFDANEWKPRLRKRLHRCWRKGGKALRRKKDSRRVDEAIRDVLRADPAIVLSTLRRQAEDKTGICFDGRVRPQACAYFYRRLMVRLRVVKKRRRRTMTKGSKIDGNSLVFSVVHSGDQWREMHAMAKADNASQLYRQFW